VTFVDIGCGPMTSCLALTDYYSQIAPGSKLHLDYLGIDREKAMLDLASQFGNRRDLFSDSFRQNYSSDWDYKHIPHKKNGTLIFNFSYFWGQNGVQDDVNNITTLMLNIANICQPRKMFIIYLNTYSNNRYYLPFRNKVGLSGDIEGPVKYSFRYMRQLRPDKFQFHPQKPTLRYEIKQLEWGEE